MEVPLLQSSLLSPTAGHPLCPSPPNQVSDGRGQVPPQDSLPLLTTWTNTLRCYMTAWTEAELSVPSEAACSQDDIMSSLGLLNFHPLPVHLMANYLSVCVSVCLAASISAREFLLVSVFLCHSLCQSCV